MIFMIRILSVIQRKLKKKINLTHKNPLHFGCNVELEITRCCVLLESTAEYLSDPLGWVARGLQKPNFPSGHILCEYLFFFFFFLVLNPSLYPTRVKIQRLLGYIIGNERHFYFWFEYRNFMIKSAQTRWKMIRKNAFELG